MKILYVTTIGITMTFFKDLIKDLLDEGHTVDIICNEENVKVPECYREWKCKIYHHSCSRSPLSVGNLKAISEIKSIVTENKYDVVHCHTPIASICTRVACNRYRKDGLRVVYTAHGFHFFKGSSKLNWLIYYPIEKICSRFTDVLITINNEDYEMARKKMKAKRVEYVPGVGIDVDKFKNTVIDKDRKRQELGIPKEAFLLLSVGELNKNKNHEVVIEEIAQRNNSNLHYMIAGTGPLETYLFQLAKQLNIAENVHFLGYRTDVEELYKTADMFVLPSLREGLNVSLMEAKAAGLECRCFPIRGNVDIMSAESAYEFDTKKINYLMKEIYNGLL